MTIHILLEQGTVSRLSTIIAGIAVGITIFMYIRSLRKKGDNDNTGGNR